MDGDDTCHGGGIGVLPLGGTGGLASRRREDGGPGTHPVPGEEQLRRVHGDVAGAEPHARQDLQTRLQIRGEATVVRQESAFGVRSGDGNAPTGQMAQGGVVALDTDLPVMTEGHTGDRLPLGRRVHASGDPGEIEIADENAVRSALFQTGNKVLDVVSHDQQPSGLPADGGVLRDSLRVPVLL